MTSKCEYNYFVLRAQEIVTLLNWTLVNWEETFNTILENLISKTMVHNWLGLGVCLKVVTKGFRCSYINKVLSVLANNEYKNQILDEINLNLGPWGQGSKKWGSIIMSITFWKFS